ncbi:MAG TPA: DUF3891 family protein [Solirubrobacteraceae bacterium]|jgi:hypothetical protein
MLVTRRGANLTLITQPEHARLAGQLAAAWGNERFAVPAAREALLIAATHHDDGWLELDGLPVYNERARRPAHFVELPLERTVGPYSRGVESVYRRDPHAGALVSMHFSGFYTARWGIQGGSPSDNPLAAEVVATQEARWMPALREAWGYRGPRSEFDARTWHAYELMQALDVMSLGLGLADLERPSGDGQPVIVTATLARVDQPPGARIVPAVPVALGGQRVDLMLSVTAPWRLRVDPYPFSNATFELRIEARELDDRQYDSAEEAAAAFHAAEAQELTITVGAK